MDGETAQFDSIHKVPSVEGAALTTNGLHDIMMSSFYANGTEDSRDLFSNPCDLGPETDVDLLDEDVGGRAEQLLRDEEAWCSGERVVCPEKTLESVQEKEDLEVVGGEEEEDDSEDEDAEWKYVSVKSPGSGVVPVSPEPSLEDKPADERAPSGHEIDPPDLLEQSVEARQVLPEDSGFLEAFTPKESAKKQELDENKICSDLDSEVLHNKVEEDPNLIGDLSIQELQNQASGENTFSAGDVQEFIGDSTELSEEAAMESRLNPDAAEFVPISPTRNTIPETLNSFGNEFDMFKKEAEACPGEVYDNISSIPAEVVGHPIFNDDLSKVAFDRSDLTDSDVVLSSSFNFEHRNSEVLDNLNSTEESAVQETYNFAEEDEDKENMPVCDDKENMRLTPNPELVPTEDVTLAAQEREMERLEETIFENVSGTTDTLDLQLKDDSPSLDVLKERVEFDQRSPESGMQQTESTESPNLMDDEQDLRIHSTELPQAVEQPYVFESNKIPEKEEEMLKFTEKVELSFSPEPVEAALESVPETILHIEEPIDINRSLGKVDFHEFEQDLLGEKENHENLIEQDSKQDLTESEQVHENVDKHITEEDLIQATENLEKDVANEFTEDDFEIIQRPEKIEEQSFENIISQEVEKDSDVCQTHEKLSPEFEEEIMDKIHGKAEIHDFTQKAFQDSYSHEIIASEVQNVSSTPEQMNVDEHMINFCKETIKHETEPEKDIHVVDNELLSEIDKQMSDLTVNDEQQHVTERYQEEVELLHTEKQEMCSPAHEESELKPSYQMEDNYDDMFSTNLKEEKLHNEGEQYQIEIEQEFQVKSSEDFHSENLVETSIRHIDAEVEIISPLVSQTNLEMLSPSEQLLSFSPVPESIPVLETCPETQVAESPTPVVESPTPVVESPIPVVESPTPVVESPTPVVDLSSEIQIPSPVAEQVISPVQEDIPKSDLSVALEHEAVTPSTENIIPAVNFTAVEPEFEMKEVSEVKEEPVTAEATPVLQSPSEPVPQIVVVEPAVEEKVEKESIETPKITEVIPSLPLDAKSPAKKALSGDKKKAPEKSKAPAAASPKGKLTPRSLPPSRTSLAAAKTSALSPTKPSGTKPTPTERKTAPPAAGKPATPSKSTAAPLSSKPRTSTTKPSPVPTTKSAPPVKSSTTASRPGTASSKPASASTLSKPASATGTTKPATTSKLSSTTLKSTSATSKSPSATAKSTVTQSKVTEVKRAVNGDVSKPLSQNSSAPKPAPRKVPLSSSTAAPKPSAGLTKTSAKPATTASKAAPPKSQNVVNGTASKPSRPVNTTTSKPPTSLTAPARKPLSKPSTQTASDPKKAKESANKHISAARPTAGAPGARRSTDLKGSLASKTAAAKGRPSEVKAPLSNGTATEKTSETTKEVEGKIDLMIKENGVEVENDVRKEEAVAVQELCTVKEQVMLIVEEGVRETM